MNYTDQEWTRKYEIEMDYVEWFRAKHRIRWHLTELSIILNEWWDWIVDRPEWNFTGKHPRLVGCRSKRIFEWNKRP